LLLWIRIEYNKFWFRLCRVRKNNKNWQLRSIKPSVLYLCEGESESEYVDVWLTSRNESMDDIAVLCFEGLSKIDAKIKVLIKEPNFKFVDTICVFLDAEKDFNQRKNVVVNMLRTMNFPHSMSNSVPWVESNDHKKSCVFISPDMKSEGRIENIVINELRTKTEIINCIENFSRCSGYAGLGEFDEKRIVNSYITMNVVGISLGASFQKGLFDLRHSAYNDLNILLEHAITK